MTTYIINTAQAPTILCPPWCVITQEMHLSELSDWDGLVIHHSATSEDVHWSAMTYVDGTPAPRGEPQVYVHSDAESRGLEDAEMLAETILHAVRTIQGGQTPTIPQQRLEELVDGVTGKGGLERERLA